MIVGQPEARAPLAEHLEAVPQQQVGRLASRRVGVAAELGQRVRKLVVVVAHARERCPASVVEIGGQLHRGSPAFLVRELALELLEPLCGKIQDLRRPLLRFPIDLADHLDEIDLLEPSHGFLVVSRKLPVAGAQPVPLHLLSRKLQKPEAA